MDPQESEANQDRPLPFVLRVAAEWMSIEETPGPEDGALFFLQKAQLTGALVLTNRGGDVQFSDLGN